MIVNKLVKYLGFGIKKNRRKRTPKNVTFVNLIKNTFFWLGMKRMLSLSADD